MEDCIEDNIIEFKNVNKSFKSESGKISALTDINLKIKRGKIMGIIGFSGAGKSTLVRCINKLETPDSGSITVCGKEVTALKRGSLISLRRTIGMIFQNFNLLQQRTILKNVTFPLEVVGFKRNEGKTRAIELLDEVGLSDRAKEYPSRLSGGQKQRVAIARALALTPKILLCDEATSALDPETTAQILRLLKEINEKYNITIVIISHQLNVIKSICDEVAVIDGGKICETGDVETVLSSPSSEAAKRLIAYEKGVL